MIMVNKGKTGARRSIRLSAWRTLGDRFGLSVFLDLFGCAAQLNRTMSNPSDDETLFLKDLVKTSRQRAHHVKWIDRDGTERTTVLTPAEASRLNAIAHARKVSKSEVLRQAAHIPVNS